jgi:ComF family protein
VWCQACDARVARLAPAQQQKSLALDAPWQATSLIVVSAARYETPLLDAIHALKYDGTPALAEPFSPMLFDAWCSAHVGADVIVPVPLHARRQRERGYNQSELLARRLSILCGVPMQPGLLRRVRYTEQQARLKGHERRRNVHGAFVARAGVQGKRIALIDDVFTTGSTLVECASAILGAGAAGVCALTLARAGD